MMRRAIRNLSSNKQIPTRLCDVIINGKTPENVYIEQKTGKNQTERIPWLELKRQVENAIESYKPPV